MHPHFLNYFATFQVYESAVEALNHIFFVGLQEEFEVSSEIIVREFDLKMDVNVTKERDQSNEKIASQKAALKADKKLMKKLRDVNHYDVALYKLGESDTGLLNLLLCVNMYVYACMYLCIYVCIVNDRSLTSTCCLQAFLSICMHTFCKYVCSLYIELMLFGWRSSVYISIGYLHFPIAGVKRFCEAVKRYPDLYEKVKARKKVKC